MYDTTYTTYCRSRLTLFIAVSDLYLSLSLPVSNNACLLLKYESKYRNCGKKKRKRGREGDKSRRKEKGAKEI